MDKHRLHRLATILKEAAAGPEHNRIQSELDQWANTLGFTKTLNVSLPNGGRPDVFRCTENNQYLFIGDEKNSENETPDNFATHVRISGYMDQFTAFITDGSIKGGHFAIATDNEDVAKRWVTRLDWMAFDRDLSDGAGNGAAFKLTRISDGTWVAWW
jgi:hypothetical protein